MSPDLISSAWQQPNGGTNASGADQHCVCCIHCALISLVGCGNLLRPFSRWRVKWNQHLSHRQRRERYCDERPEYHRSNNRVNRSVVYRLCHEISRLHQVCCCPGQSLVHPVNKFRIPQASCRYVNNSYHRYSDLNCR